MCEIMPLTGFEPRSSGDGSDRSAREHSPLGGSNTVQLVFSLTRLDLINNENMLFFECS